MKKILMALICLALVMTAFWGCAEKDPTVPDDEDKESEDKMTWEDDGVLKILTIGNSFSDDGMEYVWNIANSLGIKKIKLGNLYIGGCDLDSHLWNANHNLGVYAYRTNTDGKWITVGDYNSIDAIKSENWDYISMQQVSGKSGVPDSYSPLNGLIETVQKNMSENTKLVWHMTWAYQQDSTHGDFYRYDSNQLTMYNRIVSTVKSEVLTKPAIKSVIPSGTAIQNARTSFIGDHLTRDGYHLTMDLGRYIAGLAFVGQLTGKPLSNVTYAPESVGMNYKKVALEAAANAIKTPFEITKSEYEVEPTFDASAYNLLDLELVPFTYWISDSAGRFDKQQEWDRYFSSRRFTREEIPVGSVIVIAEGWQYRPEGWKDDKVQSSRPATVALGMVEVTEAWWGDYIYRAFNISKDGASSLVGLEDEAAVALKVYIPKK